MWPLCFFSGAVIRRIKAIPQKRYTDSRCTRYISCLLTLDHTLTRNMIMETNHECWIPPQKEFLRTEVKRRKLADFWLWIPLQSETIKLKYRKRLVYAITKCSFWKEKKERARQSPLTLRLSTDWKREKYICSNLLPVLLWTLPTVT